MIGYQIDSNLLRRSQLILKYQVVVFDHLVLN